MRDVFSWRLPRLYIELSIAFNDNNDKLELLILKLVIRIDNIAIPGLVYVTKLVGQVEILESSKDPRQNWTETLGFCILHPESFFSIKAIKKKKTSTDASFYSALSASATALHHPQTPIHKYDTTPPMTIPTLSHLRSLCSN